MSASPRRIRQPISARCSGEQGNPYATIGADENGRVGIDLGVYGVPETFVVTGDGKVAYRFVGPLSDEFFETVLLPEIEKAARYILRRLAAVRLPFASLALETADDDDKNMLSKFRVYE